MITPPTPSPKPKSGLLKKQFPTILGLLLLVIGLVVAATLFSQGTGIFLPRATPETTPKNIRISNVTDDGFYVSFLTDSEVSGFVKYGEEKNKYTQVGDERDQLTGTVGNYMLHYIRVKGLQPATTYYYVLGTGSGALFDDNGEPFVIKTAARAGTQPKVSNAYGTLMTESGLPADGSIVFVTAPNAGTQSSLVRNTGSWAVSLSNARTKDGSDYAQISEGDELAIQAQGKTPTETVTTTVKLVMDESIALAFGSNASVSALPADSQTPDVSPPDLEPATSTPAAQLSDLTRESTPSASPSNNTASASAVSAVTVVDLSSASNSATPVVVETTQPVLEGKAPANVVISVEIHSDNQISTQVTADANGDFSIDVEALGENLEPGEHSVTYSYVDPATGKTVTATKNFTVKPKVTFASAAAPASNVNTADSSMQIALATPTPTPYGTNNPYPIPTATPATKSGTATSSATPKPTATPKPASGSAKTATTSGTLMTSGSVGTTALLLGGGLFFLISGLWSWWIARELQGVE